MSWGTGENCQAAYDAQRAADEARSEANSVRWDLEGRIDDLRRNAHGELRDVLDDLSARINELWDTVNSLRDEIREAVRS